jgi:hypothetical protein
MKIMPCDRDRFLLLISEFDFRGIEIGVEFATDCESFRGRGVGDEINDRLIGLQRPATPVEGDLGEEPVLDLVKAPG